MTTEHVKAVIYQDYLTELSNNEFSGDIATDFATRISMATDSSIYQVLPQAVCFPRSHHDIETMMRLAAQDKFRMIQFCPRGGGTGTNGQSLTSGIVIDCSRYMTEILEVNLDKKYVRVQAGVVLDQLNHTLRKHDVFFAPYASTASHATLGGMFSTDACGKGSCHYGQTSDHIIASKLILANGETVEVTSCNHADVNSALQPIHAHIENLLQTNQDDISLRFSNLPRHLSGYNLGKAISTGELNLNYILSGSEGTLAIVSELTLALTPVPKFTALIIIKYESFDAALRHAKTLLPFKPLAIETLDEHILSVTRDKFLDKNDQTTHAINLVEFTDQNTLTQISKTLDNTAQNYFTTTNPGEIFMFWEFRKRSVGILANLSGTKQPIPFVEDTAVPPEHLADYIAEFKALLASYGLKYGMFGHADAGCIHVRPALDMKQEADTKLIPIITKQVYALIKKYNGLMWSEHGRGYRSELVEDFFGDKLHTVLREIKTQFDPYNQLNPGKIVTPLKSNQAIVSIDGPYRGNQDRLINQALQENYDRAIRCNGNGACFNYEDDALMCPSYHATKDRVQSPKGRAALIREWLKSQSDKTIKPKLFKKSINKNDLPSTVFHAMQSCVGCKACASRCPVHIDIPEYKSSFLEVFHKQYGRPIKDYLIGSIEFLLPYLMRIPSLSNLMLSNSIQQRLGLCDLPKFSNTSFYKQLKQRKIKLFSLNENKSDKLVTMLVDPFVASFKPHWAFDTHDLLTKLGYDVRFLPIRPTGKPMHAKGFLKKFNRIAQRNNAFYKQISEKNIPIIGIDPGLSLCFRDEYRKTLGDALGFNVQLLPEFLSSQQEKWKAKTKPINNNKSYHLFNHCTEKSLVLTIMKFWSDVFTPFGLKIKPIKTSCCGMAGSFGHENENQEVSKKLFAMSWENNLNNAQEADSILVTGFSCSCQISRLSKFQSEHPATVLNQILS